MSEWLKSFSPDEINLLNDLLKVNDDNSVRGLLSKLVRTCDRLENEKHRAENEVRHRAREAGDHVWMPAHREDTRPIDAQDENPFTIEDEDVQITERTVRLHQTDHLKRRDS